MDYEKFYYIAEIVGTVAFASSGTLVAIRKGMDIFGIVVLAIITAVGGGIIRDITLGITPPMAFRDTTYTSVSIVTALVLIVFLSKKIKILSLKGVNRIPIIFTKNTIYAVASLLGAVVFIVLRPFGANFAFFIGASATVVIRLLSMKYRWSLPDVSSDLVDGDD